MTTKTPSQRAIKKATVAFAEAHYEAIATSLRDFLDRKLDTSINFKFWTAVELTHAIYREGLDPATIDAVQATNIVFWRWSEETFGEEPDEKWKYLGDCTVDTGTLLIIDPCYLAREPKNRNEDYHPKKGLAREIAFKGPETAVTVATGLGDGVYPVEGKVIDFGGHVGERVVEIRIRFTTPDKN